VVFNAGVWIAGHANAGHEAGLLEVFLHLGQADVEDVGVVFPHVVAVDVQVNDPPLLPFIARIPEKLSTLN